MTSVQIHTCTDWVLNFSKTSKYDIYTDEINAKNQSTGY